MNDFFFNDSLYLTGLNKFNIAFNKSGHYIPQNKIRFYYKNQEITQLFKPRTKLHNRIAETNTVCAKFLKTFFFCFLKIQKRYLFFK